MASRIHDTPLALALLILPACGPTTDTTDSSTSADTGSATGTTGTATGTTDTPTSDSTVNPTTVDPTTEATTAPTTDATTGEPACPDELPPDGTPCTAEGQFCGGPCEDPCAFCNVTKCEGGVWMGLEVFPANCLDCDTVCTFVVPAACTGGPPDQAACVTGCMATQSGECGILFNKTLACIGDMPTFSCDADNRPNVAGCEAQFTELYACQF